MPFGIDATVLEKVGVGSKKDQDQVVILLKTCATLVHPNVSNSLTQFGRNLKRKMEEMDELMSENARLVQDTRDEDAHILEMTSENNTLRQQLAETKARMIKFKEEATDLREIQKRATKTSAEYLTQITALTAENKTNTDEWEHRCALAKRETNAAKKRCGRLEEENTFLKKSCEQKTAEVKKATADLNTLKKTIETTLDERESAMIELTSQAFESRTALETMRIAMDTMKNQATSDIDDMRSALNEKQARIAQMIDTKDHFMLTTRSTIEAEYQPIINHMTSTIQRFQSLPSFSDKIVGLPSICPVPTTSGYVDSFRNIILFWQSNPSDSEGKLNASFVCAMTGYSTSIASVEQIYLIRSIAADLHLPLQPPFLLQFRDCDEWIELPFHEQLAMASMVCKIFRRRTVDPSVDHQIVMGGQFILTTTLKDSVMDFHLTPLNRASPPPTTRIILTEPMLFDGMEFANSELVPCVVGQLSGGAPLASLNNV